LIRLFYTNAMEMEIGHSLIPLFSNYEDLRNSSLMKDGSFSSSLWNSIQKNKVAALVGISAVAIGVGFYIYHTKKLPSVIKIHPLVSNNELEKENSTLKEIVVRLEKKIMSMETKMEGLENCLSKVGMMCAICLDQIVERSFVPCGHSACDGCSMKLAKCPFCLEKVDQVIGRY